MECRKTQPEHDARLIAAARRGEIAAFASLVERHQGRIYRFALKNVGTRERARDIARRTFLVAYARVHSLREQATVSTWLLGIALDLVHKELSGQAAEGFDFAGHAAGSGGMPGQASLQTAIDRLPAEMREPLVLVSLEQLGCETAADLLHIAPIALRTRIAIALASLGESLELCPSPLSLRQDGTA